MGPPRGDGGIQTRAHEWHRYVVWSTRGQLLEPVRKVELMQEALLNPDRVEVEHDQETDDAQ